MSAANYLVRWMPDIVEATDDDIDRFGTEAAQVLALLNYLPTMSDDAVRQTQRARDASDVYARDAANKAARYASAYDAARRAAEDAARGGVWGAALDATRAEVVSDIITPEQYRILTNPLNAGRTLQERMGLMLPDQQGPFMKMVNQLSPVSVEDILAIDRLNSSPNVDALLEMLGGMAEGQSLARRIKAAETMYRIGRGGKGMS